MKDMKSTVALVCSVVALLLAVNMMMAKPTEKSAAQNSAYERIMKTRTIRCAYQPWPPYVIKDPNTGKISGVIPDLFERMGRDLTLKIDWAEEVGSANMFEGFATGRYDMFCSALTAMPARALVSDFSRAIGYLPFYLYAREGDTRFDNAYDKANSEAVSMMYMDGDFTGIIENELFPKAKKTGLPNLTNGADLLVGVAARKADLAVDDPTIAEAFIKTNPGKIRRVAGPPLRFPSINVAMPLGEDRLRALIDTSFATYLDTGVIDALLNAYGLDQTKVLRVVAPYNSPAVQTEGTKP